MAVLFTIYSLWCTAVTYLNILIGCCSKSNKIAPFQLVQGDKSQYLIDLQYLDLHFVDSFENWK